MLRLIAFGCCLLYLFVAGLSPVLAEPFRTIVMPTGKAFFTWSEFNQLIENSNRWLLNQSKLLQKIEIEPYHESLDVSTHEKREEYLLRATDILRIAANYELGMEREPERTEDHEADLRMQLIAHQASWPGGADPGVDEIILTPDLLDEPLDLRKWLEYQEREERRKR